MGSFRFVHAADLHIDSPLRGLSADSDAPAEQIRAATRDAFSNLVELALREQVAFVLIAGDLFDGEWLDWRTGQFLIRKSVRLHQAGIRMIGIRGNHDAESIITRRLPNETIRMLPADRPGQVRLPELEVCIHGQSFATREVTENLARNYPPPLPGHFNIGLLHTVANGRDGHANYAPCSVDQLAAHGYDYWALGHVHQREVLLRDPCWIVFPGNTQGRHIGETGAKGASLVTVQDGRVTGVEHRELDVMRWALLDVDATGADDPDAALGRVRSGLDAALTEAGGRPLAVRLLLRGACPAHSALVRDLGGTRDMLRAEAAAAAGTGTIWLESVQVRTRPALDIAAMRERSDAVGMLVREIDGADPTRFAEPMKQYFGALLDRATGLRPAMPPDHPAILAAAGVVSAELLERAKNLLLARLAER